MKSFLSSKSTIRRRSSSPSQSPSPSPSRNDHHVRSRLAERPGRVRNDDMANCTKLFIANVHVSVSSEKLEHLFEEYGKIIECQKIEGKGYAFVVSSWRPSGID
jgi:hypothetical protein